VKEGAGLLLVAQLHPRPDKPEPRSSPPPNPEQPAATRLTDQAVRECVGRQRQLLHQQLRVDGCVGDRVVADAGSWGVGVSGVVWLEPVVSGLVVGGWATLCVELS